MRKRWIRVRPERQDDVGALMAAGVVAASLGAVTFYLTRLFLAREPVDSHRVQRAESGAVSGEEG
jgi:hypothetical protein